MFRKFIQNIFNHHLVFCGVLFILGSIFFPNYISFASSQVSLEWSPNSESDLAGYRLFCREEGKSYDYTTPSWEGAEPGCTIYGLEEILTYCFVARAFDIEGFESGDSEEVCYAATATPENIPPTASAGPDQTKDEGKGVTLNGSNSADPDDGIASYQWTQIKGPSVTLSGANEMESTFTAPDVGPGGAALTFELTVFDFNGSQSKDFCVVYVTWLNAPPQANAGFDQTASEGDQVTLDGSASLDIDDGIASYHWVQTRGSTTVILSDPNASQPTFTAPNVDPEGTSLDFELTVTDTGGLPNSDTCIANITWKNQPPSAIVEDYIEAEEGTTVVLDGSRSSDPDDGIKSYHWDQLEGLPVTLSDPGSARPKFVAPKADPNGENMIFRLTVKDIGGLQGSANGHVYVMSAASSDQVSIVSVNYDPKPRKLTVKAISTASPGSVKLTASATYGNETVNLGDLIYSTREQIYEKTFRKVDVKPTSITVTSSSGGSDTR